VAEEERIVVFAMDAHEQPEAASPTVDVDGLDVLQANAARAVAGDGPLVLVVGPAGTGKTTALARAAADLRSTGRPVFGLAPTAKAARVLETGTSMPADTVAKLLYEWHRPDGPGTRHQHRAGTTLVVDEAGMLGTHSLDRLVSLTVSQRWRLVLVGDPRQLQAVGRGGMFDELCRTGRVHELATIHRFTHRWEQTATLRLRVACTKALDAYLDHGRVTAGDVDAHLVSIASAWIAHNAAGEVVAVTAETNQQVDALNLAIQVRRRAKGELCADRIAPVAGSETVSAGDVIVTRRNDRSLRTDDGEPVRNREQWSVDAVNRDGSLTVSRVQGHRTVTLPADYVRSHVRLGYAATAHGHQGDTVDVSYTLVSTSTTHRGLYVGATRGRHENHLCVVTEEPDLDKARDVLEQVLTNDRADVPAIVQRRELAAQVAASSDSTRQLTDAERLRRRLDQLQRQPAEPRGLGL
jgi:ATP-dependent exoDNAse (exonuclease V) alpha subunit